AGYTGDHFCGPLATYLGQGEYPGVPLHGLADGRCDCCAPVTPPCVEVNPLLPPVLRMRILRISVDVGFLPSIYTVGQEFDFPRIGGVGGQYTYPPTFFRDACPVGGLVSVSCEDQGDGTGAMTWLNQGDGVRRPMVSMTLSPLRIFFELVTIGAFFCEV